MLSPYSLQCLYCERVFRDYVTLKDHMRKKQHKKISGQNHAYDRFYAINYLQAGKGWAEVQAEDDREILPQGEERSVGGAIIKGRVVDRVFRIMLIFFLLCYSSNAPFFFYYATVT